MVDTVTGRRGGHRLLGPLPGAQPAARHQHHQRRHHPLLLPDRHGPEGHRHPGGHQVRLYRQGHLPLPPRLPHRGPVPDRSHPAAAGHLLGKEGAVKPGDTVVITAGVPIGISGTTNLIKQLPLCGVRRKEDPGGLRPAAGPGRAGQPGAGLQRRVHRRRGGHPRPHRPLRAASPAGEAGLQGNIYCTRLTGQLLSIMLRDSAHIQESDAQWQNQKGKRAGRGAGGAPVHRGRRGGGGQAHGHLRVRQMLDMIADGVKIRFVDAGHLLGSASVEMWLTEGDGDPKGGLLRGHRQPGPAHHPGSPVHQGGRLCGHREHLRRPAPRHGREPDYTADLAAIIDETLGKGATSSSPPSPWAAPRSCCTSSGR